MAVQNDFSGPVNVGQYTLLANITGLEYGRFTVRVSGIVAGTTDGPEVTFWYVYTDKKGDLCAGGETVGIIWVDGVFDILQDFDFSEYASASMMIHITGANGTIAQNVAVENYRRREDTFPVQDASPNRKISFNIERLVPRFLLTDKNGYALAKAIEHAFQLVAVGAQYGIDIIQDPYKMPEWRLDELAGELGCLYDYSADIDKKRYWIINATYLYTIYGTPYAIYNFLEGYFASILVEEAWEYEGMPYHFRVTVSGSNQSGVSIAWAQKAVSNVKNVRSVLDAIIVDNSSNILVTADMDYFNVSFLYAAEHEWTNDNDMAE